MMTDDELDLLASSYLDGEATPDEVARVEADPELRARVQQLRSVRVTSVTVPPALAHAQLAQAMALYQPGSSVEAGPADVVEIAAAARPVVDLSERRREREERAGRLRWLSSAAAVLVVGVGAVALVNRIGGGEDAEMATADTATEAAAEVAEAAPEAGSGAVDSADTARSEMADEAAADDSGGGESEALADFDDGDGAEAADAEQALALEEAEEEETAELNAARTLRDLPESGFFPDEPVADYDRLPTGDEMVGDLELPWRDEGSASCLEAFPSEGSPYASDEVEVIAYLPFEVTVGEDAGLYEALYVIVNEAEEVVVVLQAGSCAPVV